MPSAGLQGAEWRQAVKAAQAKTRRRKTTTATTKQPVPSAPPPMVPPGPADAGLTATAHCISRCEWTAGPGPAGDVDKAAEKHTTKPPKHPTATVAEPKAAA